ncbi:MAG: LolA family protein, partial [Elusimicrobiota bacterium]
MSKTILIKSIRLISLIITLTFTIGPVLHASNDFAEKIIEQVIEKYSEFQSYSSNVEIIKTISSYGAENEFKASYDIDISRPNKFSLRHTGGIFGKTMVSNGEQMWIYISDLDKYTRLSPPAKVEDILKPGRESLSDFTSEQFLIFSFSESYESLSDIFNGAEINLIDTKENYYLISLKNKNIEMKLHVDKKDFSIHKVEADMSPTLNMHNNQYLSYPEDVNISYVEIHKNIAFDQSLNSSLFTFKPPENAEKAKDLFFQDSQQDSVLYKDKHISEKEFIEPESGRKFTLSDLQGRFIILCLIDPKAKLTRDFIDDLQKYSDQKEKTQIILVAKKENEKELIELLEEINSSFKGALDSEPYINEYFSFKSLPAVITVGPKGEIQQVYSGYFEGLSQMIMDQSHRPSLNNPPSLSGNTPRLKGLDIKWKTPLNVTQIISDESIYALSPSGRLYTVSLSGSVLDLIHIRKNYNR